MQIYFNKTCSSHMPILLEFVNTFKPKKVLEFGSGFFSTKVLLDKCSDITSIEIQNKEWYNLLKSKFTSDKWKHIFTKTYQEAIDIVKMRYRLIFIDSAEPRLPLINFSFSKSKNIIVHDTQIRYMSKVEIPENFVRFTFHKFPVIYKYKRRDVFEHRPWSSLFTSNTKVIEHFKNVNEIDLYKKYKFPYGVTQ